MSASFITKEPTLEDYWRGIILLGRNSASYKFALAKSLLELKPQSGQLVKLGDLAPVFARNITEHLKVSDKQGSSKNSKLLNSCRSYNTGNITHNELVEEVERRGFVNVIDAFHVVGNDNIPKRFFIDERKTNDGIRITDEYSELLDGGQSINLPAEVESRWNLVETAWNQNISRSLLSVEHDPSTEYFFVNDSNRRKAVTSSRPALNGYQKGKCFYCFSDIYIDDANKDNLPDVDHFFPHALKKHGHEFKGVDGIWNLVLSCKSCNRGVGGKFDSIPTTRLLARLHRRNEYLISSHLPLRETLISHTGSSEQKRRQFLNDFHIGAYKTQLRTWEADEVGDATF
ncbi:HNH endonuclease [Candidatus Woesearchaeota archaeon]|jgi:5-methylcytosine-specific restriction endonuclease McrA|nr:HNH endonuclease [Candidatus Woesearchaeota archaeon]